MTGPSGGSIARIAPDVAHQSQDHTRGSPPGTSLQGRAHARRRAGHSHARRRGESGGALNHSARSVAGTARTTGVGGMRTRTATKITGTAALDAAGTPDRRPAGPPRVPAPPPTRRPGTRPASTGTPSTRVTNYLARKETTNDGRTDTHRGSFRRRNQEGPSKARKTRRESILRRKGRLPAGAREVQPLHGGVPQSRTRPRSASPLCPEVHDRNPADVVREPDHRGLQADRPGGNSGHAKRAHRRRRPPPQARQSKREPSRG